MAVRFSVIVIVWPSLSLGDLKLLKTKAVRKHVIVLTDHNLDIHFRTEKYVRNKRGLNVSVNRMAAILFDSAAAVNSWFHFLSYMSRGAPLCGLSPLPCGHP